MESFSIVGEEVEAAAGEFNLCKGGKSFQEAREFTSIISCDLDLLTTYLSLKNNLHST
jgi:hypothetical protein